MKHGDDNECLMPIAIDKEKKKPLHWADSWIFIKKKIKLQLQTRRQEHSKSVSQKKQDVLLERTALSAIDTHFLFGSIKARIQMNFSVPVPRDKNERIASFAMGWSTA